MKRRLKNALLSLLGFSAAPMLTACYGVEPDVPDQYWDRNFQGQVTDTLGNPIEGARVYVSLNHYYNHPDYLPEMDGNITPVMTDAEGKFDIYVHIAEGNANFVAEDVDGAENGLYQYAAEYVLDFDGTLEMVPIATEEESGEQESGDNL